MKKVEAGWGPSLFTRLFLVFVGLTLTILLVLVVGGLALLGVRFGNDDGQAPLRIRNVQKYAEYLVEDLGVPPDPAKARALTEEAGVEFRVEKGGQPLIGAHLPPIAEARARALGGTLRGAVDGRLFVVFEKDEYDYGLYLKLDGPAENPSRAIVIGAIVAASLLTLLALGYLFSRRLFLPLRDLSVAMARIAGGRLEETVPVRGRNELAALASSFNSMAAKIRNMMHDREQLLLDVSHELRSPLTRMRLALEMTPDGAAKEAIAEDAVRLEKLIALLLDSARLDQTGRLSPRRGNLASLTRDAAEFLQHLPPGIDVSALPTELEALFDRTWTEIVLRNVLENACKYSASSGVPVRVEGTDGSESVEIRVIDSGVGIPAEEIERVFEPFYRVDKSRAHLAEGFGLGLHLCRRAMEAQGGRIGIESVLGKGTTVTLRFMKDEFHG